MASIESAILDLDTLCRRAPTVERLNLLGSAYKRLAQLEEAPRQLEALVNMAHHYRLSFDRQADAYSFTNWVAAGLLAGQRDDSDDGPGSADPLAGLAQELDTLYREKVRSNTEDPNFWDAASLADLELTRLLAQGTITPRQRAAASPGEAAAPILAAYRDAIGRAASPREISSLCENIAFLLDLWSPRDKVTIRILEQLKESLQ